ncbi:DUF6350 family protein [Leifsonia bigeumensis]|uniref:DUF6350 family protein n=1 Tax=Leifsonella bigeumensis TaxID=433643 RepID=A0ABP7FAV5_9MICO
MNRPLTALFAALEALLVVGIGIGIPLVPLTFLWAFQYGLQLDWTVFWRASADIWILGHGGDVLLTLDPVTVLLVGFEGAGKPFVVSIAALGFALLTVLLAMRAGRRIAETPFVRFGTAVALVTFGLLALGIVLSSLHRFARPSLWQGALFPTLVFAIGLFVGVAVTRHRLERMPAMGGATGRQGGAATRPGRIRSLWLDQPVVQRTVLAQGLRGGAAAVTALVAASGILLTLMIVVNYGQVVALYEGIHAGVLGGIAITLGQLAFLPNLVIWTASWLVGPGFAIGTGSSVGPLGTSLGPLPAVPVFGALPAGDLAFGFLGLLVPVVAGFLAGVAVRPAVLRGIRNNPPGASPLGSLVVTGIAIGVVGGVLLGLLAWVSGGAAGPGRLADVGPDALLVGLFAALEFGVPAIIGLLAGRPPRSR